MKQFVLAMAITLAAAPSWIAAAAATSVAKRVSVTGEIIDTWCIVTMIMVAERSGHYQFTVCCAVVEISISIKDENENFYAVQKVEGENTNVVSRSMLGIQANQVIVEGDLIERDGAKYLLVTQVTNDDRSDNLFHKENGIQRFGK